MDIIYSLMHNRRRLAAAVRPPVPECGGAFAMTRTCTPRAPAARPHSRGAPPQSRAFLPPLGPRISSTPRASRVRRYATVHMPCAPMAAAACWRRAWGEQGRRIVSCVMKDTELEKLWNFRISNTPRAGAAHRVRLRRSGAIDLRAGGGRCTTGRARASRRRSAGRSTSSTSTRRAH